MTDKERKIWIRKAKKTIEQQQQIIYGYYIQIDDLKRENEKLKSLLSQT